MRIRHVCIIIETFIGFVFHFHFFLFFRFSPLNNVYSLSIEIIWLMHGQIVQLRAFTIGSYTIIHNLH